MPTRRSIIQGLALTTGAALTRKLAALELTQAQIARDPMRPQYHLLPAHGWMNDPCGPLYWKGRYHMFYQYNSEPVSAVKLWAHATSSDMIHWRREPVALAPTPGGPDADGCWTGTAAIVDGKPTFLYTGVVKATAEQATLHDGDTYLRESVCMAVAEDDALQHWRKVSQAVIAAPPAGMKVAGFRDPSPWRDPGNHWNLIVASGERKVGGMVLLYTSKDFQHWEYLHPMARGTWNGKQTDVVGSGEMWECPDFFPLDDKHVLIHSSEGKTIWQIGTLDLATMLFHAESEGVLDYGAYYAPKSQLDAHGHRILWGWITESRPQAEYAAAGWSGMMSLPRRLSVSNGQLVMEPPPEAASLRTAPRTGDAVKRLPTAAEEIRLTLLPTSGARPRRLAATTTDSTFEQSFIDSQGAAILLRADPQLPPGTARIGDKEITGIDSGPSRFNVESYSSTPQHPSGTSRSWIDHPLDLHIFLDHSVAEIFFNHRHAITCRYYKRDPMEPAVAITLGGNWRIEQQQAWSLKSIW